LYFKPATEININKKKEKEKALLNSTQKPQTVYNQGKERKGN